MFARSRRALPLFAFIATSLIASGVARADEAEDAIVDAIQRGRTDGRHPVVLLMESLNSVPDFSFTPTNISSILDRVDVSLAEEEEIILGNFSRVTKRGNRIDLRTNGNTIPIRDEDGNVEARLRLDRSASFNVREEDGRLVMDGFKGVKAGTASSPMVNIKRVRLTPQNDGTVEAEVTVKILFFDRTERFTLPAVELPPQPTAVTANLDRATRNVERGERTRGESIGVVGALGR